MSARCHELSCGIENLPYKIATRLPTFLIIPILHLGKTTSSQIKEMQARLKVNPRLYNPLAQKDATARFRWPLVVGGGGVGACGYILTRISAAHSASLSSVVTPLTELQSAVTGVDWR